MDCLEQLESLLISIEAYPISAVTTDAPLIFGQRVVSEGSIHIDSGQMIQLPFSKKTAVINEIYQVSSSGQSYEVTVEWTLDNPTLQDIALYNNIIMDDKSLIISTYNHQRIYIPAAESSCRYSMESKEDKIEFKVTIPNECGAVRIVP